MHASGTRRFNRIHPAGHGQEYLLNGMKPAGFQYVKASFTSAGLRRPTPVRKRWLKRVQRIGLLSLVLVSSFIVLLAGSGFWAESVGVLSCSDFRGQEERPPNPGAVALIDPLASQFPDIAFVEDVASAATRTGHGFDYYPPEKASLSLLANLPLLGYSMIIFRTHGVENVPLITVSDKYNRFSSVADQLMDRLAPVDSDGNVYLGVLPRFITDVVCGQFSGTTILAMGCSTMLRNTLADAFVKKGATVFVGWNKDVTVSHTDTVFASLAGFLLGGNRVDTAVRIVTERLGADPVTGAGLSYVSNVPAVTYSHMSL